MPARFVVISLLCALHFISCISNPGPAEEAPEVEGTYFSVLQFAKDQFDTYWGQPFTLERIIVMNGKRDSALVSSDEVDWAAIVKIFAETDISDKKYLDKYQFAILEDDVTDSRTYYYEAKEPQLFTRSLQIITDRWNNKIKSIFIETAQNNRFSNKNQKLYYVPVKLIQIQDRETHAAGRDSDLIVEYRFLY